MNSPVFIGQMLEEAKRFLEKNDCMENICMKGAAKPLQSIPLVSFSTP